MNLKERIAELENQLKPKKIPYDKLYGALYESELRSGKPPEIASRFDQWFVEKYGTEEAFVKKCKLRERNHGKRF